MKLAAMAIADREGLEAAACECYEVMKKEYARLLGMPLKIPAKAL